MTGMHSGTPEPLGTAADEASLGFASNGALEKGSRAQWVVFAMDQLTDGTHAEACFATAAVDTVDLRRALQAEQCCKSYLDVLATD